MWYCVIGALFLIAWFLYERFDFGNVWMRLGKSEEKDFFLFAYFYDNWDQLPEKREEKKKEILEFCNQKIEYYQRISKRNKRFSFLGDDFYPLMIKLFTDNTIEPEKLLAIYDLEIRSTRKRINFNTLYCGGSICRKTMCRLFFLIFHQLGQKELELRFCIKFIFDDAIDMSNKYVLDLRKFDMLNDTKQNDFIVLADEVLTQLEKKPEENAEKLVVFYYAIIQIAHYGWVKFPPKTISNINAKMVSLYTSTVLPANAQLLASGLSSLTRRELLIDELNP